MKKKQGMLVVLISFYLSGCIYVLGDGKINKEGKVLRGSKYTNAHPELKEEIKNAIISGELILGMTKEQVKASWGEPKSYWDKIEERDLNYNVILEEWRYGKYSGIRNYIYFENGKLVDQLRESVLVEKRREYFVRSHKNISEKLQRSILNGRILLKMTREQAWATCGRATKVNTDVGSWGEHEQWVYDEKEIHFKDRISCPEYIYIENGIVSSWQD